MTRCRSVDVHATDWRKSSSNRIADWHFSRSKVSRWQKVHHLTRAYHLCFRYLVLWRVDELSSTSRRIDRVTVHRVHLDPSNCIDHQMAPPHIAAYSAGVRAMTTTGRSRRHHAAFGCILIPVMRNGNFRSPGIGDDEAGRVGRAYTAKEERGPRAQGATMTGCEVFSALRQHLAGMPTTSGPAHETNWTGASSYARPTRRGLAARKANRRTSTR